MQSGKFSARRAAVQRLQREAPVLRQQTDEAATKLRQLAAKRAIER
jgi:hypothetical protein